MHCNFTNNGCGAGLNGHLQKMQRKQKENSNLRNVKHASAENVNKCHVNVGYPCTPCTPSTFWSPLYTRSWFKRIRAAGFMNSIKRAELFRAVLERSDWIGWCDDACHGLWVVCGVGWGGPRKTMTMKREEKIRRMKKVKRTRLQRFVSINPTVDPTII